MLLTDEPISDSQLDELDVTKFVRRLIRPLIEVQSTTSIVVGLYGAWGQGKSSALNLLEKLFDEEGQTRAVVIRFNPWLYDDAQSLLLSFFGTLQSKIGGGPFLKPKAKATLKKGIQGMAAFAAPATAFLPKIAGDAVAGGLKGLEKLLEAGEVDFQEKKADVSKVLLSLAERSNPLRVVVLIDDLDRAGDAEIRAMLKLVKLIADLPNISYVLSMDDRRVREVLGQRASDNYGAEFLDKIIQVPVHLPPIPSAKLKALVLKGINNELGELGVSLLPDTDDLENGFTGPVDYNATIAKRVRTLRDRARLLNTLKFALRTGDRKLEVDSADLVLLCFLQTFYPDVYEAVRRNKSFLTGEDMSVVDFMLRDRDKDKKAAKRRLQLRSIAGASLTNLEDAVSPPSEADIPLRVLGRLFPHAETGMEHSNPRAGNSLLNLRSSQKRLGSQRRICRLAGGPPVPPLALARHRCVPSQSLVSRNRSQILWRPTRQRGARFHSR